MRHLGNTLHILAAAAIIATIWSPIGAWWQWLASAALLFLAGALAHGTQAQGDHAPTNLEDPDSRGDNPHPLAEQNLTGNATGPTHPRNNYGTPA